MLKLAKDYYRGFEGNPEITFVRQGDGEPLGFTMWVGYFDEILDAVQPTAGGWTGLALYYHTVTGWYDEDDWKVPDLQQALVQLGGIDPQCLSAQAGDILRELIEFLKDATPSEDVHIRYS